MLDQRAVPAGADPDLRYVNVGLLGQGGMGEVRRVYDRVLGRVLAMKVIHASLNERPRLLARFRYEARWAARLQHPGMVPVHDVGLLPDGRLYFTMREVKGRTFGEVLEEVHRASTDRWEPGPSGWTFRRLLDAFVRVCETMAYAHAQGVIHRDLKPDNIMLGAHGEVLVLDWGLVKVVGEPEDAATDRHLDVLMQEPDPEGGMGTRMGSVSGTPAYMPPEQAMGLNDRVDARSDIYALGAILYELLGGSAPYADLPASSDILEQVRTGPPTPLGAAPSSQTVEGYAMDDTFDFIELDDLDDPRLPEPLVEACNQAMARVPDSRFQTARALAEEIRAWLDGARRREDALEQVDAAEALVPRAAELRDRAQALRAEAARLLDGVQPWQPEDDKAAGWAKQDEADDLDRQAALLELEQRQDLHAALRIDGELPEAHAALAERLRKEHAAAEAARDADAMARTEVALRGHVDALPPGHSVRAASETYLQGDGTLTIVTDPPGAEVLLSRFEPRNRRLVPVFQRSLGHTPLRAVPLAMGSYQCVLRHPGCEDVVYPVSIGRGEHWHGRAPGERRPHPVHLPRRGSLEPDDCYVPAGWFHSGGDPKAGHGLPKRRLWCDGFVVQRFPVTNAQFVVFLDDLVRQGRVDEALAAAPQERGGAQIFAFDGTRFTMVPDADGDVWEPEAPILMVDFASALAYARWMAAREPGWRLVGSLEREKAGRGADGRFFPWGDAYDPSWVCNGRSHAGRPIPQVVDSFPTDVSVYGVRGLGGNVRDWCPELRLEQGAPVVDQRVVPPAPEVDPDLRPKARRVTRGGYWTSVPRNARCANRSADAPGNRLADLGIRLARSI